jgi:lipopolysaccharide biosynthesis glycosyltransferase
MKNYPIVTLSDSKYLEPTKYLLTSIIDTYMGIDRLKFYIMHVDSDLSEIEKTNFKNYFKLENVDIIFATSIKLEELISSGEFDEYTNKRVKYLDNIGMGQHTLPNTKSIFKMWIGDAIPEDEIIFLDSDTFLFSSIEHFFDIPSPKTKFAASLELWPMSWTMHKVPFDDLTPADVNLFHRKYLPNLAQEKYTANFNTGSFITSLDYWRSNNFADMTRKFMKEHIILYTDQDILNYIFNNNYTPLPLAFNSHFKFILDTSHRINYKGSCPSLPVLIHFCGDFKPLFKNCRRFILHDGTISDSIPDGYKSNPVLKRYLQIQRKDDIANLYVNILKRTADTIDKTGLNHYAYSEFSLDEIRNIFLNSKEYKNLTSNNN